MPLKYDPHGSLDHDFQNESPGADKEANWLPAPKGPVDLRMRACAPERRADRQIEPAAGHQGARAMVSPGAVSRPDERSR